MTRLSVVIVFAGLLVLAGAAATPNPEDGKYYKIKNFNSGKFLAVTDDSTEAGAKIVQADAMKKDEAQHWKLVKAGEHYKLINRKSGKALEVRDGTKDGGVQLQQGKDRKAKGQEFSLAKDSGTNGT